MEIKIVKDGNRYIATSEYATIEVVEIGPHDLGRRFDLFITRQFEGVPFETFSSMSEPTDRDSYLLGLIAWDLFQYDTEVKKHLSP